MQGLNLEKPHSNGAGQLPLTLFAVSGRSVITIVSQVGFDHWTMAAAESHATRDLHYGCYTFSTKSDFGPLGGGERWRMTSDCRVLAILLSSERLTPNDSLNRSRHFISRVRIS